VRSTLASRAGATGRAAAIDEAQRAAALDVVRHEGFARVLDVLDELAPARGRLLDVGCAHGWFVAAALRRGWDARGVDPDAAVVARGDPLARARISVGWFPADAPAGPFAAVTFHDAFEHLDDVGAALAAARATLEPQGLLVLSLPWAGGILHRLALVLARVGIGGFLDRLWQRDFPSPHLSYFTPDTLVRLCARHGLDELHREPLRTVRLRGLWSRLRFDRTRSLPGQLVSWLGVALLVPFLRVLPPDVGFQVFRARSASAERP
jgi:SAM-dependent methyltransferase